MSTLKNKNYGDCGSRKADYAVYNGICQQNAKAIFDALEESGVQGGSPVECNQQANTEYQNMNKVKQRQVAREQSKS